MTTGRKLGMVSLNQSLMELVQGGAVTAEEAYAKAIDKGGLAKEFERLRIPFTPPTSKARPGGEASGDARPAGERAQRPESRPPKRPDSRPPSRPPAERPQGVVGGPPPAKRKKGWFG